MESTCQRCDVTWKGDAACWVCGHKPRPSYRDRPPMRMTAGAQRWRHHEDGGPEPPAVAAHSEAENPEPVGLLLDLIASGASSR